MGAAGLQLFNAALYMHCATKDGSSADDSQCTCIEEPTCAAGTHSEEKGNCGNHGQYPYYCCVPDPAAEAPVADECVCHRLEHSGACGECGGGCGGGGSCVQSPSDMSRCTCASSDGPAFFHG